MLKKTITYTDYNGNSRTEDFYFNLSKAELARMEMSVNGGMVEMIERLVAAQDAPALLSLIEEIIHMSYGVKTPDGRGFMKRKEDLESFMSTEAYSELYMELFTNSVAMAEFMNGVVPSNIDKAIE